MRRSYAAALTALNAGTGATTNLAELIGSATRKVRLLKVAVSGTILTAAEDWDLQLRKQSTADTGGTPVAATAVPLDSVNDAASAVFKGYSAAPTAGTLVGVIGVAKLPLAIAPAIVAAPIVFDFSGLPAVERPTLHGIAETLALAANGVTPAHASSVDIYAWWTEEPL